MPNHEEHNALNWVRVSEHAGWQPRDSQGEVVFNDRMWVMGGWFGSYEPAPRDVWSSADGEVWEQALSEAPWTHSDLPVTVAFNGRMWLMGGWSGGRLPGHEAGNDVWSSVDGVHWAQATAHAEWSPRLAAGIAAFRGRMWILGGIEDYYFGDDASLKNDVWCSRDGVTWDLVTKDAGWAPRAYHQAVVFDDKLWILGGGNYVPNHRAYNDVWCSADGASWKRVSGAAAWAPRLWFSAAVYRERIWVLGGWSESHDNFGDVWCSHDGATWVQMRSDVIWTPRHEHSAFVHRDRLWVAGGHARPLSDEVWSLYLP